MKTIKKPHQSTAHHFTYPDAVHVFHRADVKPEKPDGTVDIYVEHKVFASQEALDKGASQVDFASQVITVPASDLAAFNKLVQANIK
ncbi:hypothetical protein DN752_17730 [Echinicola strongylocentroti]|uniref:Uncharacterized protein n=1 Tax=Echinicola strongylocentroti TaxID=1795355 RepID=A0A2Z4IL40_9BACT|nr:hypothetical protein [Echinicola strongylocentroti]AWW31822.1 hypothetical protein DN752_17730 [Echinicola strongylocentroti]